MIVHVHVHVNSCQRTTMYIAIMMVDSIFVYKTSFVTVVVLHCFAFNLMLAVISRSLSLKFVSHRWDASYEELTRLVNVPMLGERILEACASVQDFSMDCATFLMIFYKFNGTFKQTGQGTNTASLCTD